MMNSDIPQTRTARRLRVLEKGFGLLFILCVFLLGYEIVARYVFGAPTIWVHEATVILVGVNFAVGGIFVLYDRAHINIVVVYQSVPPAVQRIFDILISLVSTAYLCVLAYATWGVAAQAWRLGEKSGTAWNPPLPMILKAALFASLAVMALIAAVQLFQAVRRLAPGRA
jgi:TRAP-type C4-dicarboxylate transport system permease small subunit